MRIIKPKLWLSFVIALLMLSEHGGRRSSARSRDGGHSGATLPVGAPQYSIFVLTTGTPTLYVCNANPCMNSGNRVASGGGGGGGGANIALSNLSGVAINAILYPAQGSTLNLEGYNDDETHASTAVFIEGGTGGATGAGSKLWLRAEPAHRRGAIRWARMW